MNTEQIVIFVYACLIEFGGLMGFFIARSKPSLIAGGASAFLLFVAFGLTFWKMDIGLWMAAIIAALLVVMFGARLAKTRKFMPSGMLLILSVVAACLLFSAVLK